MGQLGVLNAGEEFVISGVYEMTPDKRWWPRLRNWIMRRPPPMVPTGVLKRFRVVEVL